MVYFIAMHSNCYYIDSSVTKSRVGLRDDTTAATHFFPSGHNPKREVFNTYTFFLFSHGVFVCNKKENVNKIEIIYPF